MHGARFISREYVIEIIGNELQNINYRNFKNSVYDDDLHDMYMEMWLAAWKYQENDESKEFERTYLIDDEYKY